MNVLRLIIGLFVLSFFVHDCGKKEAGVVFERTEMGICEYIDTVFIGVILNMTAYGGDLFLGDFEDPMIIHYNLHTNVVESFLSNGRGPNETLPPITLYANPCGNNRLYRFSKQAVDMGFYPIDSLFTYIPLFRLSHDFQNVTPYYKDKYIAVGYFNDDFRYKILNSEGTVVHSFGKYPNFLAGEDYIPASSKTIFHQVVFANSFLQKKLVAASSHILDIIDYSLDSPNESIKRILLTPYDYDYTSGNYTSAKKKDGIISGAYDVACDEQSIYLLFNPRIVGRSSEGIKKEIWVFDWDGHPIKKIILDKNVMLIAADPTINHNLFGLASTIDNQDEQYEIVKIKL